MKPLLITCFTQVTLVCIATALLYFLASRRRPSVRAAVIGTAVLAIGVVTALSFSPLPSWWTLLPDAASAEHIVTPNGSKVPSEEYAGVRTSPDDSAERPRSATVDSYFPLPIRLFHFFRQAGDPARGEGSTSNGVWPTILLLAIAIGAGVFLVRVAIGLQAIQRLYRQSQPLTNAKVNELLTRVQQLARCPRSVPVRQSPHLVAAATIGWLRPVIILPADWVEWSDDELLAVLAHEMAHVCRRDYSMRLIAYVVVALHFYHPLIHWLTRRLVQEQELASDTLAATLAGGRRRYLHALSKTALRQDDRPNVRPGSIALPVSSRFLMRRIDMLRAKDGSVRDSATRMIQWMSVMALVLFSVGVSAIRCVAQKPDEADRTRVASRVVERINKQDATIIPDGQQPFRSLDQGLFQRKPFDPSMIARKGSAVCVVRPADFFRRSDLQPLKDACNREIRKWIDELAPDEELPFKVEQIELLAGDFNVTFDPHRVMIGSGRNMVRTTDPFDWRGFFLKLFPDTVQKEYRQREYLELPAIPSFSPAKQYVFIHDDRTMLFTHLYPTGEPAVRELIDFHVDGPPRCDWTDHWAAIDGGLMTIVFYNRQRRWLHIRGIADELWKPFVSPLLDGAQFVGIGADWSDATNRFVVQGRAISEQQEQSDQIKQTIESLLGMARIAVENDESLDENRKLIWPHVVWLLQSASLCSGMTPEGLSIIDGRIQTEVPVDQLLHIVLGSGIGS
jgi:beta-lactamase regulating signal transducer with metallopeptidase domain